VTAPIRVCSAASNYHQWRCPLLSIDVRCANDVLETIRVEAVDAFNRLPHGGLETGGMLLGRQTEGFVEILACQPLVCEHSTGPSFVLSEKDEMKLEGALAELKPEIRPIGLYMTHSRRGFSLVESDRRIMDRYFPELWQMALLLMPSKLGPTSAGFFVRSPGPETDYLCTHELVLQVPERHVKNEEPERPDTLSTHLDIENIPSQIATLPIVHMTTAEPVDRSILALDSIQPLPARETKHSGFNWLRLIGMLALMILCTAIAASLWTRSRVVTSRPVSIHISDVGSKVRIEWDPSQGSVRDATGASLEIHDGESLPKDIPITRDGLDSGGIVYAPRSEKLEVRLKLLHGKEPPIESAPYFFINPVMSTGSPLVSPVPTAMPADASSVISNPVTKMESEKPIQSHTQEQKHAPRPLIPPPSGRTNIVARPFRPPVRQPSSGANVATPVASLPKLPEIHAAEPPLSLPALDVPSIEVRPSSAPVAAPTPATNLTQPRSGRLIWTGDLRKGGLLSLSPTGASIGVLNGRFPGFPVRINVQPAELVDGGIAVFSSDRTRSGTSEPPSTRNGWNVVVYKWDPKRTSDLTLIESPGASNGWRQLVLRNGNHNISVLVVDWQREGAPVVRQ